MKQPTPPWTIDVPLPAGTEGDRLDLLAVPAAPGVCLFEDGEGKAIGLGAAADLRRHVRTRLDVSSETRSRRVNYREVTRRIRVMRVGSVFESDWACLQIARARLPATRDALRDRYQAWYVHCDPAAAFPRWSRCDASEVDVRRSGTWIGPIPSRRAANRYVEVLEDAFDLCRYHHILVLSPGGVACAYKEMGRCPAPCDGTISLDAYREQIVESMALALTPPDQWRAGLREAMTAASTRLDFEHAETCRRRLERTAQLEGRDYAWIQRLQDFRLLAVQPVAGKGVVRLFTVLGGRVEPVVDVMGGERMPETVATLRRDLERWLRGPVSLDPAAIDTLGLVSWHLHRPPARRNGVFLPVSDALDEARLVKAVKQVLGHEEDMASGYDETFEQVQAES